MSLKNPYKAGGMFEGANHLIFEMAKDLRNNMTAAENVLWLHLRGFKGLKFRRQHPIGIYIADFYCHRIKLIIEIDGSIHNQLEIKEQDDLRQKELESWNYYVIRFTNEQVLKNIEEVLSILDKEIDILIKKQNASSKDGV